MAEHKKKVLMIGLNDNWVFEHRFDDITPTEVIKAEVEKYDSIKLHDISYSSLSVIYEEDSGSDSALVSSIMDVFATRYPDVVANDVLVFQVKDFAGEETTATKASEGFRGSKWRDTLSKCARRILLGTTSRAFPCLTLLLAP